MKGIAPAKSPFRLYICKHFFSLLELALQGKPRKYFPVKEFVEIPRHFGRGGGTFPRWFAERGAWAIYSIFTL